MLEIRTIQTRGAELGYSVHGEATERPPLVFVHGYALRATLDPYQDLLGLLSKRYTVYALDMRGHGASAAALSGWSLPALADDIADFVSALSLDRPFYVGHSLGAFLGLWAEMRYPGLFSALCLLTPAPAHGAKAPAETVQFYIEHGRNKELMRGAFRAMFMSPTDERVEIVAEAAVLLDPAIHRTFLEEFAASSIEDRLKDVKAPALVLLGAQDIVSPIEEQWSIGALLPHCKQVTFSNQGHMMPNEHPELTAHELLAFLDHYRRVG